MTFTGRAGSNPVSGTSNQEEARQFVATAGPLLCTGSGQRIAGAGYAVVLWSVLPVTGRDWLRGESLSQPNKPVKRRVDLGICTVAFFLMQSLHVV